MDIDVVNLFKTAVNIIPDYDGNPNRLFRFISTSESVLTQFYQEAEPDNFQNQIVLQSILGKLKGKAEEVVNIHGCTLWSTVKQVLLQHFSDQRDENVLTRDLVGLRQENENTQEFYTRCMQLLNTIINYISLHEQDVNVQNCKRSFFTAQTLKTFLAGLKEPLGSSIRAMRPTDMPTALMYIKEEENIQLLQKTTQQTKPATNQPKFNFGANKPSQIARIPNNFFRPNLTNQYYRPYQSNQPRPINFQPNFNQFRMQRPFVNNRSNSYRQNPQPMSGLSYRSAQIPLRPSINPNGPQNNNYFQPVVQNANNDFIIEEVHNTEQERLDVDYAEQTYGIGTLLSPTHGDSAPAENSNYMEQINSPQLSQEYNDCDYNENFRQGS